MQSLEIDMQNSDFDMQRLELDMQDLDIDVQTLETVMQNSDMDMQSLEMDVQNSDTDVQSLEMDMQNSETDMQSLDCEILLEMGFKKRFLGWCVLLKKNLLYIYGRIPERKRTPGYTLILILFKHLNRITK